MSDTGAQIPGSSQHASAQKKEPQWEQHINDQMLFQANILQNVRDGIIVTDLQGNISYWNEGATHIFGYQRDEVLGKTPALLYPDMDQQQLATDLQRIVEGNDYTGIWKGRKKDGTIVWIDIKTTPMHDEQGNIVGFIGVSRDITQNKLAEEQLRDFETRKDEFVALVSHELKTPVTSLKGFTQVLQRRFKEYNDEQTLHFLTRMDRQLGKLSILINDLLEISTMPRQNLPLHYEDFGLNALVQEIVENLQATTLTHRILVENGTHVSVYGDRDRIGQVLTNLLNNAIKYSPNANKVLLRITVNEDYAMVSIQDFGIGITQAHQQNIFERFYHIPDPIEKTFPGLGIGLYISREIIRRHQGRIWVESKKDEGSTFNFTLPLSKTTETSLHDDRK
ncbi:MAG: PAS domain S-box protein [Ktedonobacteraceae bacterium]|nr:PAS domain S-box protein [Ktedonobacteraceae bacterium]MBV9614091.1 PAS domain S-box protein [Ktedonobacteraceae bacterium]